MMTEIRNEFFNCVQMFFDSVFNRSFCLTYVKRVTFFTMNYILKETQYRIGDSRFFNWSIYKNNCSVFIKEILITLGLFNKSNIKFVNQEKILKHLKFSNFTLHIINILCAINNIFDNYMFMR